MNCRTLRTLILRTHIAALGQLKPRLVEGQLNKKQTDRNRAMIADCPVDNFWLISKVSPDQV